MRTEFVAFKVNPTTLPLSQETGPSEKKTESSRQKNSSATVVRERSLHAATYFNEEKGIKISGSVKGTNSRKTEGTIIKEGMESEKQPSPFARGFSYVETASGTQRDSPPAQSWGSNPFALHNSTNSLSVEPARQGFETHTQQGLREQIISDLRVAGAGQTDRPGSLFSPVNEHTSSSYHAPSNEGMSRSQETAKERAIARVKATMSEVQFQQFIDYKQGSTKTKENKAASKVYNALFKEYISQEDPSVAALERAKESTKKHMGDARYELAKKYANKRTQGWTQTEIDNGRKARNEHDMLLRDYRGKEDPAWLEKERQREKDKTGNLYNRADNAINYFAYKDRDVVIRKTNQNRVKTEDEIIDEYRIGGNLTKKEKYRDKGEWKSNIKEYNHDPENYETSAGEE
jgi:hypothetical protein